MEGGWFERTTVVFRGYVADGEKGWLGVVRFSQGANVIDVAGKDVWSLAEDSEVVLKVW